MDANNEHFGEELQRLARQKGLRKLRGELDYEDWVFTAQGKLEKLDLWSIISTPRPGPIEIDIPTEEIQHELKRRLAQRTFEQALQAQGIHTWGSPLAPGIAVARGSHFGTAIPTPTAMINMLAAWAAQATSACAR